MRKEAEQVLSRYARRTRIYSPLDPAVYMARQEVERALIRWLRASSLGPPARVKLLEIGCGSGGNLLQLLRLGFEPCNLLGNELQQPLIERAAATLPEAVNLIPGDAMDLELEDESLDVVFQSLVFSSILDPEFQQELASRMWRLVRPGGGVLWYDFIYDNPRNPDVIGIGMRRVKQLFPGATIKAWKITLAPPLARFSARLYPPLYSILNAMPILRTHIMCWLSRPLINDTKQQI